MSVHTLQAYQLCTLNVISAKQKFVLFEAALKF